MKRAHSQITRRDFLAGSAAAFGGLATGAGHSWGGTNLLGLSPNPFKFTSIGLVPFEETGPRGERLMQRIANPSGGTIPSIENANFFPQGDREFVEKGLRLTVWAAVPRTLRDAPDAIDVEILYEPFHSNRFRTWSFRRSPAWTEQSPCRLCVPIDSNYGLNLNVSMGWGQTTDPEANTSSLRKWNGSIRLAVSSEPGAPKLMRGIYAIPLKDRGEDDLRRLSQGQTLAQATAPFLLLETEYGDRHADIVA